MSDKSEIIKKIRVSLPYLSEKYHVDKIGIFGSYARNEQIQGSDVDILVEFSMPIGLKFSDLATELEEILHEKVDLVSIKAIKPKYLDSVKEDLMYV
ncbi:MAG: nucleotidyltransferase family protein [Ignavibacteria bacterium]|nr:nucleotidyltransferase family protein [Ignavibacteria bacterium]